MSKARFILFRGGSRSGKSFAVCHFILTRALLTPNSRHGIFRQTAVDVRTTIFDLTFKNMMDAHTPGLWESLSDPKQPGHIHDGEMTIELPNGAMIMFAGLDDSTRQERILGNEYNTVFVNEISQFRQFDIFQKLIGRLSLETPMDFGPDHPNNGKLLTPKLFLDCNPTTKRHWSYRAFMDKVNPISGETWPRPDEWAEIQMNPVDNTENISSTYLADLENLSAHDRKRFLMGEWRADNDNALFDPQWWTGSDANETKWKRLPKWTPEQASHLKLVTVNVDPAGSSKPGADETGITVTGIDHDDHVYVLADYSGRMAPNAWGTKVADAAEEWDADYIVAEKDYGCEMVENTIRSATNKVLVIKPVGTKGRNKETRAMPVATLYEQGRVSHCGTFEKLEGQMEDFHIDWDRRKDGSPDRLDSLVWGITELAVVPAKKRGGGIRPVGGLFS